MAGFTTMAAKTRSRGTLAVADLVRSWRPWPVWAFLVLVALLVLLARAAAAEGARGKILEEGRQDFEENCVACHGSDARGTGELGPKLIKPPRDLTAIAGRNGGEFPFWRVFEIIAGEKVVPGHDTFQMPRYSTRMRGDDFKPGYLPAHVRVLELTHYLESIQAK